MKKDIEGRNLPMAVTKVFTQTTLLETQMLYQTASPNPPFQSPSFNVGDDRLIFKIGQGMGLAVHVTLKPGVKRGIAGICQQRILGKTFVTALCIFQGLSPYKSPSNPRSDRVFGMQTLEKRKVRMS